jgi:membrane fusion protein, multidrug efflux system
MNWKKIIAIVAGIALVAAFVLKLKSNKNTATENVYHFDKEQPINVQVQKIMLEEVNENLPFTGTFFANRETKLSAETQGKINSIAVNEGSFVKQGQALVQLDNALLKEQLHLIDVQIQNAKVEYEVQGNANQIQIDGLQKDVNRYRVLAEADAIQGVQLEKAEIQLKTAKNQRLAILQQGGLKTAEAQRKSILEQINKTSIKAPFAGVVTLKFTEIGSFAGPGVPLLQISDLANLKFTVNVSEKDLRQFVPGKTFSVYADVYPDQALSGKITMVGSKANMGGLYPVEVSVRNFQNNAIKAGMFGKVALQNDGTQKGIIIPSSAIIGNANQPQVYIVKDGKAQLQNIIIAKKIQDKSLISSGINEGDILVTNGLINLFEGANVKFN